MWVVLKSADVQTLVIMLQATAISINTQTNQIMQTQQLMGIAIRWALITNLTLSLTPNLLTLTLKICNTWAYVYMTLVIIDLPSRRALRMCLHLRSASQP